MTEDEIINRAILAWNDIKHHHGDHTILRESAIQKAEELYDKAMDVAPTHAHPAWSIYNNFVFGLTDREWDDFRWRILSKYGELY